MYRLILAGFVVLSSSAHAQIWINEFHYDNSGGDVGEFIEVVVGPADSGVDLSLLEVELVNGSNGTVYGTHAVSTFTAGDLVSGYQFYSKAIMGIQNGAPDGLALASNGSLLEFLSYEGTFTATGGSANGVTSTNVGVSEPSSTPVGASIARTGSGSSGSDFTFANDSNDTPGQLNNSQTLVPASSTPSCTINSPSNSASVAGTVTIDFDGSDPGSLPLTSTFEYSTNSGSTWNSATSAGTGTASTNPDAMRATPFSGVTFDWDTGADGLGLSGAQTVDFRITVDNGSESEVCTVTGLSVNNQPGCTVNSPSNSASVAGDVTVNFDASSPTGNMLTADLEYSTNGGTSFSPATDTGTGSLTGNPTASFAAGAGLTWGWQSSSDVAATATVEFRITVTDSVTGASNTCIVTGLSVDNQPGCTVNAPANSSSASGTVTIDFDAASPSGNMLNASFEYSTNGGTSFATATDAGTGGLMGNPATSFAAGNQTWDWASPTDVTGAATVELRIIVSDAVTGSSDTCLISNLSLDNRPMCTLTSPADSASVAGTVSIVFDATSQTGNMLAVLLQYSTDGGTSYSPATDAGAGTLTGNPTAHFAAGTGLDWAWDSANDVPGSATVEFRLILNDVGTGTNDTCTVAGLSVANGPGCTISSPANSASVSADVTVTFGGSDPGSLPLTSTFEYSTNGGASYSPATAAGGSPTANPDVSRATPFSAVNFVWDSVADGLSTATVDFRITVDNGSKTSTCTITGLAVDNVPTCTINSPADSASVADDVTFNFDASDPSSAALTSTFEYTLDGGVTYMLATPAAGSSATNPDAGRATPFSGLDFIWDSAADGVAGLTVDFRISVDNGSFTSTCGVTGLSFAAIGTPSCTLSSPGAGAPSSGDVAVVFSGDDTISSALDSSFEYSVDGGSSWMAASAASGSSLANPDTGRATPFSSVTFLWDSDTDLASVAASSSVDLRVIVTNGTNSDTCSVAGLDFDRDRDGLGNAYELAIGTDPDNQDSDGDGVDDGVEVAVGTMPDTPDSFVDEDGDGIPVPHDSDDTNADVNGDGIMDGFALALNQNGSIDTPVGFADPNLDGVIDFADVGLILRIARTGMFGGVLPYNLDMNRDGMVTIADGMILLYAQRDLTPAVPLSP